MAGDRDSRNSAALPAAERKARHHPSFAVQFLVVGLILTMALIGVAQASTDGSTYAPTSADFSQAIAADESSIDGPGGETNPEAAGNLPHTNLGREEALGLLQAVFPAQLEAPAGIFDDLEVERFLAPDVAVIAGDGEPVPVSPASFDEAPKQSEDGPEPLSEKEELRSQLPSNESPEEEPSEADAHGLLAGATLLDSSIPLRTESPAGDPAVVDLSLQRVDGDIEPVNALVEVGMPEQMGDGIELPEQGITIHLADAPQDRGASIVDDGVSFVPNVAEDTDLAIAPTPTGVETLTQIRSADAPTTQTFTLDLPAGSELVATNEGGATVTQGDETLVDISSPTALDATGADVPVALAVSGDSLTLTVSADSTTAYPVLVDPLYQTYEWTKMASNKSGICNSSFEVKSGMMSCETNEEWSYEHYEKVFSPLGIELRNSYPINGKAGLYISTEGALDAGDHGTMNYTVPRFFTDKETYGEYPTSFVSSMQLSGLEWTAWSQHLSPYLFAGIWDIVNKSWVQYYSHEGLTGHGLNDPTYLFAFNNPNANKNAKVASLSINVTETYASGNSTKVFANYAALTLADSGIPGFGLLSGPSGWVNQTATPITFTASDSGLGVRQLVAGDQAGHSWTTTRSCVGVSGSACPRWWKSTDAGAPALTYDPSVIPQGISNLTVLAVDPVSNTSAPAYTQVKVDHTAPSVVLSGTMTEQAKLGIQRPTYALKATATDGTEAQPQSGVGNVRIEVDGTVVASSEPGCATQNCEIPLEWTLESSKYSAGQHSVIVTATDGVNLSTTKSLTINLDPSPPGLVLSGTMTEQGSLGTSRPRYKLKLDAAAEAGLPSSATAPSYSSSFGSYGTGNGQLASPGDVARDSAGNLWVVDKSNNRIQKFNEKGEYLSKFGSYGTATGQFSRPTSIAIAANGNIWVTDAGNNRIQQFNESGTFLKAVGSLGTGNGQFNGPEGIAIDTKGNLWISDTYNARLQKLNEKGEFIKVVGTKGSTAGQLIEPTGIDIGPGGNVWVTDWANNRVEVYTEEGAYIRQFGSTGSGDGQFNRPDALAIDGKGNVWVGDQNNGRVQLFNQSGEFVSKFGSPGSGGGQFSFSYPMGIATDSKGNIWVADTNNHRIQKWVNPNYAPAYSSSFGSTGSGTGQFNHPAGVAVANGNIWVVDENNNRVQKFSESGEYLSKFGTTGSGNGQFSRPTSIAIDPKGNLWVTDAGNNRIQQFNDKGEFLKAVGSYGTGNGQFNGAEGIAIDAQGNLWVGDTYNGRLQKFNEKGEFIKVISSKGSGQGQVGEPTGLDIAADGSVWVADWQYNRVVVFNEAGTFVRQFGTEGTGNGQFKRPDVIEIDGKGTVWVGDQNNGRIQGFNQSGQYITQFGAAGSGQGQFSFGYPMGIASDAKGNLWISDTGNNRIQRWTQTAWQSEILTEIKVDGSKVDSGSMGCASEQCPLVREWTLMSAAYAPGQHTVLAKATDGLGNTTTKTLTINVQPDTAKPDLQVSGELASAPSGWVEQETYGLQATAQDGGYGVTSVTFKVDGTLVASKTQTCPDGGCSATLTTSLNMNQYSGGAHPAELVAQDGAGNLKSTSWTINVNPDGQIATTEAVTTLEATEATTSETPVAPNTELLEPEQIEHGENPRFENSGSIIESVGASDTTTMTANPADGFTIHSPTGATTITPTVSGSASTVSTDPSVAAVSTNTGPQIDSVVRPVYNGDQTFQAIRSTDNCPVAISWSVQLGSGQTLKLVDSQYATVQFADGSVNILIAAEQAHDATGAAVPSALSVSGNVLTLTINCSDKPYVLPIIAGQGWETSYKESVLVDGPEDEAEIAQREQEEREAREREAAEGEVPVFIPAEADPAWTENVMKPAAERSEEYVPAPLPPPGGASASASAYVLVHQQKLCSNAGCSWWRMTIPDRPSEFGPWYVHGRTKSGTQYSEWVGGTVVHCYDHYSDEAAIVFLLSVTSEGCGFTERSIVRLGEGKHLTVWHDAKVLMVTSTKLDKNHTWTGYPSLNIRIWPNGAQERVATTHPPLVIEG